MNFSVILSEVNKFKLFKTTFSNPSTTYQQCSTTDLTRHTAERWQSWLL